MKKKKICIVITHSVSLILYRGQLAPLSRRGFHITVVCDPRGGMQAEAERAGCRVVSMHINRPMTPLADLVSFIRLILFFFRNRFDIVQVSTPKASLLGSLAARITGQPFILYAYWGIYYDTQTGWRKRLFRFLDHIVCTLADQVQGICEDLRSYVIRQFSTPARKTACLLGGPDGIDLTRWTSTDALKEQGSGIRRSMGIPEDDLVIGFCGRMVRDKGICELVEAFESLSPQHPLHLLLVGDYEAEDPVPDAVRQKIADNPLIHATGWVEDTVPYFAAMDIFTLPSYREGFGNTIIEASAMRVPVIATDVTGCRESVQDGVTGLLVPAMNSGALAAALERLISEPALRKSLGDAGRERVERLFDARKMWDAIAENYDKLLAARR